MKWTTTIIATAILAAGLVSCSGNDDNIVAEEPVEVTTVNVDVVLPKDIQASWQRSIDWALDNIEKAQQQEKRRVRLNLRYHDEDTENLDRLAYELTHPAEGSPDSCSVIIGPYHSANATHFLSYAALKRLPVVMPTCTSAELQRMNARNTYAWFLTESDITQCEIMLQALKTMDTKYVSLLYTDDTYGKSFFDWFAYWTVELDMKVEGDVAKTFASGQDLTPFFDGVVSHTGGENTVICLALSNPSDYIEVHRQFRHYLATHADVQAERIMLMGTDVAMTKEVVESDDVEFQLGISPIGSVNYGFPQAYETRFFDMPNNGEAQVYDALTLIAMGAAHQLASPDRCLVGGKQVQYDSRPYEPGLTDYMRSVVTGEGAMVQWNENGLATAFHELLAGRDVSLSGATGSMMFDATTSTKALETLYMIWTLARSPYSGDSAPHYVLEPILYLSTGGSSTSASTTTIWEQKKRYQQMFDDKLNIDHKLPRLRDLWAVVISPSTAWSNYRHQADAFALYQSLRNHGYDDDHIVLIAEDNLADDARNIYPGQIFVERSDHPSAGDILVNNDVRRQAVVDYHFSDLTQNDIADIMMGRQSSRLPQVINPDSASNIFFFWSGHGGSADGPLWGDETAREYFGSQRMNDIVSRMNAENMYRRIMFAVETCFSGKWGEALTGQPDVLVLTAANAIESSKADIYDRDLGVFLSNAFSRTFQREVNNNPGITIHDLFDNLARTTNGSHVSIYNERNYGSVYTNTMEEFFPVAGY